MTKEQIQKGMELLDVMAGLAQHQGDRVLSNAVTNVRVWLEAVDHRTKTNRQPKETSTK